jgi:hypothetical protein
MIRVVGALVRNQNGKMRRRLFTMVLLEIEKGGMLLPTGSNDGETRPMVAAEVDYRRTPRLLSQ